METLEMAIEQVPKSVAKLKDKVDSYYKFNNSPGSKDIELTSDEECTWESFKKKWVQECAWTSNEKKEDLVFARRSFAKGPNVLRQTTVTFF